MVTRGRMVNMGGVVARGKSGNEGGGVVTRGRIDNEGRSGNEGEK